MARSSKRGTFLTDLQHLKDTFSTLDREHKGYIGRAEVALLAKTECGMDETVIPELLERLDSDKDGKVSFEDLQVLFEHERDATKRQKLEKQTESLHTMFIRSPATARDYSTSLEYDSAFDTTPADILASSNPAGQGTESNVFSTPVVVLRQKRPSRWSTGRVHGRGYTSDVGFTSLSSIVAGDTPPSGAVSPSSEREPDLATQMQYLTNIPESPKLKRRSKVLSWISESEDMFEDAGVSKENTDGILSPPFSPVNGNVDEVVHVKAILEGVCHTQEIDQSAVAKLCNHVKADSQEQEELIALLEHLDKDHKGHVSLDEFVQALQSLKKSVPVAAYTPPQPIFRRYSDMPIPKLSEPFGTPGSGKPHHSSTPLPMYRKTEIYGGDRESFSVLDPNNSGYVHVDSLVQQWQRMGVEAPKNQSLEEALTQRLPVDSSRRVSVSDVVTSLEIAILSEDNSQNSLRHAALQTFKGEINQLRSEVHQLSMERDKLRTNLNRTTEEKEKLVKEGDEHLEHITKISEKRTKENELKLNERIREMEREKQEELRQLQEIMDHRVEQLKKENDELKANESWLKSELKLTQEEAKRRVKNAKRELLDAKKRPERTDRMDVDETDSNEKMIRIQELEQENAELLLQNKELHEQNRGLQDRVDELSADNEKIKQKYTFQKRRLQRHRSEPRKLGSASLSSSKLDEDKRTRPKSGKRPSSASRRQATHLPPSSLVLISEKADMIMGQNSIISDHGQEGDIEMEDGVVQDMSDGEGSGDQMLSSDDGLYAKSTASLMEEFQMQGNKFDLERELEESRLEMEELMDSCRVLEQKLRASEDEKERSSHELQCQLEIKRQRQVQLEQYIKGLEQQQRRLSATKEEIDAQLANAEDTLTKQLESIHGLRDLVSRRPNSDISLQKILERKQREAAADQERQHKASVTELENRLTSMEEKALYYLAEYERASNASQKIEIDLEELKSTLEKQREFHEGKITQLKGQLHKAKEQHEAKEREHDKSIGRLGKELQSSQLALEQYKNDAQSLEIQLQKSKQAVKEKEKELQIIHGQIVQRRALAPPLGDEDFKMTWVAHDQLSVEITETHKAREEELKMLRLQLASVTKEMATHSLKYASQLEQTKKEFQAENCKIKCEGETHIADVHSSLNREFQMSKERYEIQIEQIQQELKGSQLNCTQLQSKLEAAEQQCETLLVQVPSHTRRIEDLQSIQIKNEEMLAQCQKEIDEKTSKMTQLLATESELKSHMKYIQEQLQQSQKKQAMLIDDIAVEESDGCTEVLVPTSLIQSPSRHSYQSDRSFHEEVVTQMKAQLEELQMVLLQQQLSVDKSNEMSLVQELLSNNAILKEEVEKGQIEKERKVELMALRDMEIEALKSSMQHYIVLLKRLKDEVAEKIDLALNSLQKRSDASIDDSFSKLHLATHNITFLTQTLHEMEECHTNALETLFCEIGEFKSRENSYQQEVDQLQSSLDQSTEEFQFSKQELEQELEAKEKEVMTLKEKLEEKKAKYRALKAKWRELEKRMPSFKATKTVSPKMHSSATQLPKEEKKENTQAIQKQVTVKKTESQQVHDEMKTITTKTLDKSREKEYQIQQMEEQILKKEVKIQELQNMLDTVVNEPIEAVLQYIESAPLENVNDAVFVSMQKEMQKERKRSVQQEMELRDSMKKLKQKLEQSMSDSSQQTEHLFALKQAVQEQEAELRTLQQKLDSQETAFQMELQKKLEKMEQKHSDELNVSLDETKLYKRHVVAVCGQLMPLPSAEEEIDFDALVTDTQEEIKLLLQKLVEEQTAVKELEDSLQQKQKDHEWQEMQWQSEHEEEVRALRQRNDQVQGQIEDIRIQFQEIISEQENQNALLHQDMLNMQAQLQHQLQEYRREWKEACQRADILFDEKAVLLSILDQLCVEVEDALVVP